MLCLGATSVGRVFGGISPDRAPAPGRGPTSLQKEKPGTLRGSAKRQEESPGCILCHLADSEQLVPLLLAEEAAKIQNHSSKLKGE